MFLRTTLRRIQQTSSHLTTSRLIITRNMSTETQPAEKTKGLGFANKDGHYRRQVSQFRNAISSKPGAEFPPDKDRYHLYVSLACPWAHRVLITRKLKGLEDLITLNVVDWYMDEDGWKFNPEVPGCTPDTVNNAERIREIYFKVNPEYDGRFTVPLLFDKKQGKIVSNESAEIIRFPFTEMDSLIPEKYHVDYYPEKLRPEIDAVNEWIYNDINNGVYKSGFATTQEAYDQNVYQLFKSLDRVEKILGEHKYLVGDTLTEADIRLFTTIVRFDPVYVMHFKCNLGMIRHDYPNIHRWLRDLYWDIPAFKDTTNFEHIKKHYMISHLKQNPYQIVAAGPKENILPKDK